MVITAQQIAEYLHGKIEGDPNVTISTFSKIEEGQPGAITFLANAKYESYIYNTEASVVLVNDSFIPSNPIKATLIRVPNAYEAIAQLLNLYESMKPKRKGISSLAYVAPTAKVGKDVYLGPFVAIGDDAVVEDGAVLHPHVTVGARAKVGANTEIYSNAVIYHDCKVGRNCILHAGCVIGADGFGFAPTPQGYEKIPQIGIVTIEDDVEIGANTCVDRSTMGTTLVRKGVKLDNLVQIAHNVVVGENTVMSAQCGVAGSTKIGDWCMFGGQVGMAGHAVIANRTNSGAKAGIAGSILKEGTTVIGVPAIDAKKFARCNAVYRNLPEMYKELNEMKKALDALKQQLNNA